MDAGIIKINLIYPFRYDKPKISMDAGIIKINLIYPFRYDKSQNINRCRNNKN